MLADLVVAPVRQETPLLHATFDGPRRPHLASVTWEIRGHQVTAGILAASHQVVVDDSFIETVACDLTDGTPVSHGTTVVGPNARLHAEVAHLDRDALADVVRRHLARAEASTAEVVVGRFPTHPLAITAVSRRDDGWDTIHTYPDLDGGPVVFTRTELLP